MSNDPVKPGKRAINPPVPPAPPTAEELAHTAFANINPPITSAAQVRALMDCLWHTCHKEGDPKVQLMDLALLSGLAVAALYDYAKLLDQQQTTDEQSDVGETPDPEWSNRVPITLTNGEPVPADRSHTRLKPNGQQEHYVVLSAEERARGFVEPVRSRYVHETCGATTTMSSTIAETYAAQPEFYSATFCSRCRSHYPVGADGQFTWLGSSQKVGTRMNPGA